MSHLPEDMENTLTGSQSSHASLRDIHSINPAQLMARIESYEGREKKGISDVRRTFCLFVTFDLLFVTLLWIIELNVPNYEERTHLRDTLRKWWQTCWKLIRIHPVLMIVLLMGPSIGTVRLPKVNGGIENTLKKEVIHYDYYSSYFDIFLLAVFRFKVLILGYAVCKLRHWWAIALTTAVTSAFLLAKVILSKLFSQGAFGYVLPIISFILAWIETWFLDFKVLPQEAEEENRLLLVQDASERGVLIPAGLSDGQFYSPPESEAGSEEEPEEKQDSEKPLLEL